MLRPLRDGIVRGQRAGQLRGDITPELAVSLITGAVAAALDPRAGMPDASRALRDAGRVLADGLRPRSGSCRSGSLLHLDGLAHRLPGAAAVAGVVVGACQPVPAQPVVRVLLDLVPHGVEESSAASRSIRPDGLRGKR